MSTLTRSSPASSSAVTLVSLAVIVAVRESPCGKSTPTSLRTATIENSIVSPSSRTVSISSKIYTAASPSMVELAVVASEELLKILPHRQS